MLLYVYVMFRGNFLIFWFQFRLLFFFSHVSQFAFHGMLNVLFYVMFLLPLTVYSLFSDVCVILLYVMSMLCLLFVLPKPKWCYVQFFCFCSVSVLFAFSLFSVLLLIRIVVVVCFCSMFLICFILFYMLMCFLCCFLLCFHFGFAVACLFGMYHCVEFWHVFHYVSFKDMFCDSTKFALPLGNPSNWPTQWLLSRAVCSFTSQVCGGNMFPSCQHN